MKLLRLSAFSLTLLLSPGLRGEKRSAATVAVFLNFEKAPSQASLDSMKLEVAAILEPAEINVVWREKPERNQHESFPDLVFFRFRGRCEGQPKLYGTYSPEAEAAALADTEVSEGEVLSFSRVECDRLRQYLAPLARSRPKPDQLFGRALGRVVAHEMYHMLVDTKAHGARGVSRSALTANELLMPEFGFDANDMQRLRAYSRRKPRPN